MLPPPAAKIGKLLSSYYNDHHDDHDHDHHQQQLSAPESHESAAGASGLSPMSSLADLNSQTVTSMMTFSGMGAAFASAAGRPQGGGGPAGEQPLEATVQRWRQATAEELQLKTEAKALLYENCDKFFACVGLIGRLDKDVSKVQGEQMQTVAGHVHNLATHFRKISCINDQDPLKAAETQFVHALEASELLTLPEKISKAPQPVQAVRLYMQFLPFFGKFSKYPIIKRLQEAARAQTVAALGRLVQMYENFSLRGEDEHGNFLWTGFSTRMDDLLYVLQAAPKFAGKQQESEISGNLCRLALLAEAQVGEKALRETATPGIFLEDILNEIFNRSREISDRVSQKFPGSLLDLVVPCIRESALRLVETAVFPGGTSDAENFARRVSYYFRFAKEVEDVDRFFSEVCERWMRSCFGRAIGNFQQDMQTDGISDHQSRFLQSRAIAAAAESAKMYGKFELTEEEFPTLAVAKIREFVFACVCGDSGAVPEKKDERSGMDCGISGKSVAGLRVTEQRIGLHRQSEIRQAYAKILVASLEEYLEPRQLEISAREISDHVRGFLYPRYLKQSASVLAAGAPSQPQQLTERVDTILAMIDEQQQPQQQTHKQHKQHNSSGRNSVSVEIVQAERLLARRMEMAHGNGKTGASSWRVFLLRHLIKTTVERRRAGLQTPPCTSAAAIAETVEKTVQGEGCVTLKAMLEDLKQAETRQAEAEA